MRDSVSSGIVAGVQVKPFIHTVTVTGADDTIKPQTILEIAAEFPFVEFGILLSARQQGGHRFPSTSWLKTFSELVAASPVRCSGHICGKWVREIFIGEFADDLQWPDFNRLQLNTHAEPHKRSDHHLEAFVKQKAGLGQQVIFQYDGVNNDVVKEMQYRGCQVSTLFDLSHGAGVLPEKWPKPLPGVKCGYAGGLSPSNVAEQIQKIAGIVGEKTIWIDAETRLFNEHGEFSPELVKCFLANARPWVMQNITQ